MARRAATAPATVTVAVATLARVPTTIIALNRLDIDKPFRAQCAPTPTVCAGRMRLSSLFFLRETGASSRPRTESSAARVATAESRPLQILESGDAANAFLARDRADPTVR